MTKLTLNDYKILNSLLDHDLQNYNKMSKDTGIPASTIYTNIKNLKKKEIIRKMAPQLNLEKLGYKIFAALEIEIGNMRDADKIKDNLIHRPEIIGLFKMSGNYDMLALVLAKNPTDLELIISELLKQPEVKNVHGNLSIHTYKFSQNPGAIRIE